MFRVILRLFGALPISTTWYLGNGWSLSETKWCFAGWGNDSIYTGYTILHMYFWKSRAQIHCDAIRCMSNLRKPYIWRMADYRAKWTRFGTQEGGVRGGGSVFNACMPLLKVKSLRSIRGNSVARRPLKPLGLLLLTWDPRKIWSATPPTVVIFSQPNSYECFLWQSSQKLPIVILRFHI